jgi:hypothetical protein
MVIIMRMDSEDMEVRMIIIMRIDKRMWMVLMVKMR